LHSAKATGYFLGQFTRGKHMQPVQLLGYPQPWLDGGLLELRRFLLRMD
jgi:hypothetical protein